LDRIGLAVKDMKEIALRMNAELSYQERIMDSLEVVCIVVHGQVPFF